MSSINKKSNKKTVKSAPTLSSSSTTYTLAVKNNSGQDTTVCIYHDTAVAWLVAPCGGSGDTLEFQWNLDYGVYWKKKDTTTSTEFKNYPANPQEGSHFILEVSDSNFMELNKAQPNGESGAIYIDAAANIGEGVVSTGLTLCGSPITAVNAFPGYYYSFAASPIYWLAFGDFTEGKKVDNSEANTAPIKVEFQTGVYELFFELGEDSQFIQVPAFSVL